MKRKEVESRDLSVAPPSSPATKIRRLDGELRLGEDGEPVPEIEESASGPDNEERAIILFKPVNSPQFVSPSSFSVTVNSDIISEFKNQIANCDAIKREEEKRNEDDLAVVPWVPFQFPCAAESMDVEEEEEEERSNPTPCVGVGAESLRQWWWQQQQQQHQCLIPPLPQNTSTPIRWSTTSASPV